MKAIAVLAILLMFAAESVAETPPSSSGPDPLAEVAAALPSPQEHSHAASAGLSLAELESAALASNAEIRAAARRVAVAEARVGSAGTLEDPSFMYRGWGTPLERPWDLNQSQHMFMFTQNLPGSGKRPLRSRLASQEVDFMKAELDAKKREVTARVRKAFYGLLRNQQELRFHDEQAALVRQGLESARIKYVVGKVPQQDMLKAQIALTRLVEHLIMLEQDGELARAELNTLLGRDPASPLAVLGEYEPPSFLPSLFDLEKMALDNRPELAAATSVIRQSETRAQLADKTNKPDYTLSAGYMLMPEGSRYRNNYMIEAGVTLPWLNRGRHEAEIAEANAEVIASKAELDSQRAQVFAEIQEALVRARSAQRLAVVYRNTLRPQSQAALKATLAAYQADRTDFLNLLDSQNAILEVELSYIRVVTDLESRMADLERAVGVPLRRMAGDTSEELPSHPDLDSQNNSEVR